MADGLRLHERYETVEQAKYEISGEFWKLAAAHELTYPEAVKIIAYLLETAAKYMIRHERHPDDPERKGDEA